GIRDYKVTGVQTCALPISTPGSAAFWTRRLPTERRCRPRELGSAEAGFAAQEVEGEGFEPSIRLMTDNGFRALRGFRLKWPVHRSEERRVGKEGRGRGGWC